MIETHDPVTVTVPRSVLRDVTHLSDQLLDRMHCLLERNTDGDLSPVERSELEALVRIAEISQIVSCALQAAGQP